jgi:hypothetical protein
VPQHGPEAGEIEEDLMSGDQILMTNQQAAKLSDPNTGSLYDPAEFVAAYLASILIAPPFVVLKDALTIQLGSRQPSVRNK